jgi:hypothetical protein
VGSHVRFAGDRAKAWVAASLAGAGLALLVGSGALASLAGAVADNWFQSGTFHLQAVDVSSSISDPLIAPATSAHAKPTLTPGTVSVVTHDGTSIIDVAQPNADPNATYSYVFKVYDSGTQSGEITAAVSRPITRYDALMADALVTVKQEMGSEAPFRPLVSLPAGWWPVSPTFPAYRPELLRFVYPSAPLEDCLSPNTSALRQRTEGWVTFEVSVSFLQGIPDSAESDSFGLRITFTGHETDGNGRNDKGGTFERSPSPQL